MLVAISGIDGAGKTELAKALARRTTGLYRKQKVGRLFEFVRDNNPQIDFDHLPSPLGQALSEAYADDFATYASRYGLRRGAPGRLIFLDRWRSCVEAFATVFAPSPLLALRAIHPIQQADLELHLDLPVEEALNRVRTRGVEDWDETPIVLHKTRLAYRLIFAGRSGVVVLDASARKSDVLEVALECIAAFQ